MIRVNFYCNTFFQVCSGVTVFVALAVIINSTSASTYVSHDAPRPSARGDSGHHRAKRQLEALTDAFSLETVSQAERTSTARQIGG